MRLYFNFNGFFQVTWFLKKIVVHIVFLLLGLSGHKAFAWVPSEAGHFEINYIKGCTGLQIEVRNTYPQPLDELDSYNFDWDPDQPNAGFINQKTYTFDQPGTYIVAQVITVTIDNEKVQFKDFITVEVFADTTPDFIVLPCANYRATVDIDDDIFDRYRIRFTSTYSEEIDAGDVPPIYNYGASGMFTIRVEGLFTNGESSNCGSASSRSFNTILNRSPATIRRVQVLTVDENVGQIMVRFNAANDVVYRLEYAENGTSGYIFYDYVKNQSEQRVDNLDTKNNYYCFRLTAVDACNDGINMNSNTLCSINLNTNAQNGENQLEWQTAFNMFSHAFIYEGSDIVYTFMTPEYSYTHGNADCGVEYCYQIIAHGSDNTVSASAANCVIGNLEYTPPAINNVLASYNGDGIELSWLPAPLDVNVVHYNIQRADNGMNFVKQGEATQTNILDPEITGLTPVCYKITYEDNCGNTSADGVTACAIFLSYTVQDNTYRLTWTDYEGWQNGIDYYRVEKTDAEGNLIEHVNVGLSNEYIEPPGNEDQVINYRIIGITNNFPVHEVASNQIKLVYEAKVFFPNAFTPDGGSRNNTFKVIGYFFKQYELAIYNRWGELLFITNNPEEGWDGTYHNKPAPQGTYLYSALIIDYEGKKYEKRGNVVLLRKR